MALEGLLRSRARPSSRASSTASTTRCGTRRPTRRWPQNFSRAALDQREANRAALQTRLGLAPDANAPLFGVVSRLTSQKGLDLLLAALPELVAGGGQLALLGAGEKVDRGRLRRRGARVPRPRSAASSAMTRASRI